MCPIQGGGLFLLVPATMLLAASFFVLVVVRKQDAQGLKTFGYAVAVLLWICAALLLAKGLYAKRHPMMGKMKQHEMMKEKMEQPMMQRQMMQK